MKTFLRRVFAVVATLFFLAVALVVGGTFLPGHDTGDQFLLGYVLFAWLLSSLTAAWTWRRGAKREQAEQAGEATQSDSDALEASDPTDNNVLIASGARCVMGIGPAVGVYPAGQHWTRVCLEPATVCMGYNTHYHDEEDEGDEGDEARVRTTTLVIPLCATHGEAWRAEQETSGGELESYPLGYVEELLEQWRASVIDALATEAGMDTARIKRFCARVDAAMAGPAILQVSAREALARAGCQDAKHPPAPDKVRLA